MWRTYVCIPQCFPVSTSNLLTTGSHHVYLPSILSPIQFKGNKILEVAPEALTLLTEEAMVDISHLLRSSHLQQLRNILDDPEASPNDRYVAMTLLRNANIAAGMVLPGCHIHIHTYVSTLCILCFLFHFVYLCRYGPPWLPGHRYCHCDWKERGRGLD